MMQLGQKLQSNSLVPIIAVQPLKRNYFKIILFLILLLGLTYVGKLLSIFCAVMIFLSIIVVIFFLSCANHPLILSLFFIIQQQHSNQITHFAIYSNPTSFDSQQNSRKTNKVYIVKVHHQIENTNYFRFRGVLYKGIQQIVEVVDQTDVIKLFQIKQGNTYVSSGLSNQHMQMSKQIFGEQANYITPSLLQMAIRRISEQKQWFAFMAICLSLSFLVDLIVFIFLLSLDIAILIMIILKEKDVVNSFEEKFQWINQLYFNVIRNGNELKLNYLDILVGDAILLQISNLKQEDEIFFRCLCVSSEQQIILRDGVKRNRILKYSFRNQQQLLQNIGRGSRYVIEPYQFIQNSELSVERRGKVSLIVTDCHPISSAFYLWFNREQNQQYKSLFGKYYKQATSLIIGFIIFTVFAVIVFTFLSQNPYQLYHKTVSSQIQLLLCSLPSILYLLFTFNSLLAHYRLKQRRVTMHSNNISKIALSKNLVLNLSDLISLQLQQVMTKYRIFDSNIAQFQPDGNALRTSQNLQSILANIIYISLGKYQQQMTLLKKVFTKYRDIFDYPQDFDENGALLKAIQHIQGKKFWYLMKVFPENEVGQRTWLVKFKQNKRYIYYVILEGSYHEDSMERTRNMLKKADKDKIDVYHEAADILIKEGKQFKYMLFKNIKQQNLNASQVNVIRSQNTITNSSASERATLSFQDLSRADLQTNLQFGSYIVFDDAIHSQTIKQIQSIIHKDTVKQQLQVTFYSNKKRDNLAGFEHLMSHVPFNYQFTTANKLNLVRMKMINNGCIVMGNEHDDIPALQNADVSIQVYQKIQSVQSRITVPGDFCLSSMIQIKYLIETSRWVLWMRIEIVRNVFLTVATLLTSLIYVGSKGNAATINNSILWGIIQILFFIILPYLAMNFISLKTDHEVPSSRSLFTINFIGKHFIAILCLICIVSTIGIDNQCPINPPHTVSHFLGTMVSRQFHLSTEQQSVCVNVPLLLSGLVSVINFAVIYDRQNWEIKQQEWWRLLYILIWLGVVLIGGMTVHLVLIGLGIILLMIFTKFIIKVSGPTASIDTKQVSPSDNIGPNANKDTQQISPENMGPGANSQN